MLKVKDFPTCCKTVERVVKQLLSGLMGTHMKMYFSTSPWGQLPDHAHNHPVPCVIFSGVIVEEMSMNL